MSRLPTAVIGDAYSSTHARDVLEELVEIGNRMAGQSGEKAGARVVADAFEDAGLRDVTIDEFDLPGWWRGSTSLELLDRDRTIDQAHDVIALPGTPAGDVEADFVDLGYGVPDDIGPEVEDTIVMVRSDVPDDYERWVHRMEKYAAAVEHGASGFVFRNHVRGCLPPTGEIGWGFRPAAIPACGVSFEAGGWLARNADETASARLSIDCRTAPTTSVNAEGVVGPDTDEEVLVTAHVDCHDIAEGARDNGAGSALVAEIGRVLAHVEDDLETRVRLVTFGSEEVGLWGARHFAATHDRDAIKCVLNIDGAGESRNPHVRTYGFDAVEAAFEAVTDELGVPLETGDELNPHTDAWAFAQSGIPAVTAGSVTTGRDRGWGHTHADTLDKLDARDLRELAIVFASTAVELARTDHDVPKADPDTIRDELDDHTEAELRFFDRWPYQ